MAMSESIGAIAPALVSAQKAFKVVAQSGTNPHLRSKYSTIADYLNAINHALWANDLFLTQSVMKTDIGIAVTTKIIHKSGEWIESDPCVLPVEKPNAQAVGSAISYARRYSLAAFVGLSAGLEDDDGAAASKVAAPKASLAEAAKAARAAKQINAAADDGMPF
jgi:hypothetical protein